MDTKAGCQRSTIVLPSMISFQSATTAARPRTGAAVPALKTVPLCRCAANAVASCASTDFAKLNSRDQTSHSAAVIAAGFATAPGALAAGAAGSPAMASEPAIIDIIDRNAFISRTPDSPAIIGTMRCRSYTRYHAR